MKLWSVVGVVVLLFVMAVVPTQAAEKPDWAMESITISAGEDAVSSGVGASLWLYNKQKNVSINGVFQTELGWFVIGKRYTLGRIELEPAVSFGHFKREAWVGPYLTISVPGPRLFGQETKATSMLWPILFFREPEPWRSDGVENPETLLLGSYGDVGVWIGPVNLFYGAQDFLDDPFVNLPGVAYRQKLGAHWSAKASVTYNSRTKQPMYFVSATFSK